MEATETKEVRILILSEKSTNVRSNIKQINNTEYRKCLFSYVHGR